jgi:uncharacterized membrane protein YfhO
VVENAELNKPSNNVFTTDSSSVIKQIKYSTDSIQYVSNNKNAGFAVFSEVYYSESNGGWKVFIDGKEAKAVRTNYILRGVEVPAGNHQILWVYVPADRSMYFNIELASSGLILLLFIGLILKQIISKPEEELNA